MPSELIGQHVQVRADATLVKVFHRGQLVKTHPRLEAQGRLARTAEDGVERFRPT